MKNVIGIIIFLAVGAIVGGGILRLSILPAIILGGIAYTIYQALVVKDMKFPMALWGFLIFVGIFVWLMS